MTKRDSWLQLSLYTLVALSLACTGFWMLFTTFMAHDDEGYVLWSLRQFCEGKPLYSEVFSQYGPMFYAWYRGWHALTGLVFTSESARWLTLGYWLIAAASCGYIATRLTRQWLVGIATAILSFAALSEMIREPSHPGGFLTALVSLATAVGLATLSRQDSRAFLISGGTFAAAMALTKINVGAFFLLSLGSWVALHSGGRKTAWVSLVFVALGVISAPLLLMKLNWADEAVKVFALVFAAGALAILTNLQAQRQQQFQLKAWCWMLIPGTLVVIIVGGFCLGTGTPAAQLWNAVVIAPLHHPGVIVYTISWREGACGLALFAFGLAVVDWMTKRQLSWRGTTLACLRLLGGLAVLVQLTGWSYELPFHAVFQFGPALAWLMTTPLDAAAPDAAARGRSWLAWCAVWQLLQAYPVGGSQISWGCFLFVPLLAAGCFDAMCFLGARLPGSQWARTTACAVLLTIAVIANGELAANSAMAYYQNEPLGLPGGQMLRLSPRFTGEARAISRNVNAHATLLFTTTGMLSFNIWAEKPTPTSANATLWGWLLSDAQISAITTRLREEQSAMLISRVVGPRIYNPNNYLDNYQPVVSVGHYTLWAWKGRNLLPLGTVAYRKMDGGRAVLIFAADPTPQRIAGLQIRKIETRGVIAKSVIEPGRHWRVVPVDLAVKPVADMRNATEPFALDSHSLLYAEIDGSLAGLNMDEIDAVLTDTSGAVVESFRFNKVGSEGDILQ